MLTITLTIEGDRGEGKTTLAIMIARMLEAEGHEVKYTSYCRAAEDTVKELIASDEGVSLETATTVVIDDRCTFESVSHDDG